VGKIKMSNCTFCGLPGWVYCGAVKEDKWPCGKPVCGNHAIFPDHKKPLALCPDHQKEAKKQLELFIGREG